MNIQGFFSYDLSEKWRGGVSLKFLYSSMAEYNSFGMGVDAGLSYYDSEKNFSFGFMLKNIGAQFKSYYDERQRCLGTSSWVSANGWLMLRYAFR